MAQTTIDRLIVNSPYEEPQCHWRYDRETRLFDLVDGRRRAGYPGASSITKRLLEHWQDPEEFETRRFFFCQLEAVETLI